MKTWLMAILLATITCVVFNIVCKYILHIEVNEFLNGWVSCCVFLLVYNNQKR